MKYWSKSSLSIYKYLETMSKTLDKIVLNTGKTYVAFVADQRWEEMVIN